MFRALLSTALTLLALHSALAQQQPGEFGVISKDELALTTYAKDPEAEAVVLFDVGESSFYDTEKGYDIRFTRSKRIKILNRTGIKHAEVSIPFYEDGMGGKEKVVSVKAFSYNLVNDKVVKKPLDPRKIYEEKINDRWSAKKFVFPDVQEGTIVEYEYMLYTPFHFNLPDWQFQDYIPTAYSQYTLRLIPFYEYVFLAQGIKKFDFQQSVPDTEKRTWGNITKAYGTNVGDGIEFTDMIHTYVMKDVPSFKDESFITSAADYLIKLDFQLAKIHSPTGGTKEIITTWPELNKALLKNDNFGKYSKNAERLAKKLLETEILTGQESTSEKSRKIIEFVKANFSWNGHYGKFAFKSPKEFLQQKTGNAAEINLFLHALLSAAEVPAHPVILSTRNHGKIKTDYPFDHFFNYVIVLVEGDQGAYLTDATEALVAFNRLPPRCINDKGLLVKEKEALWVDLYSAINSLESKNATLQIDPATLTAKTAVTIQSTEFDALAYRSLFQSDSATIKERLLSGGFTSVSNIKTYNFDKISSPYIISFEGEADIERIDNKLLVSPFLHFPLQENKLKQKERSYPVDFIYSKKEAFSTIIDIPAGYKVLSVPEALTVENELLTVRLKYEVNDKIVQATAEYHFKKGMYVSAEYARIKGYMDMIVRKFNEQVVFEAM